MRSIINLFLNLFILTFVSSTYAMQILPKDFVYLHKIAPSIQQDIRYATSNNFVGRPLPGYLNQVCILTKPTALALLKIQEELNKQGRGLKVFDGFRPQMTVDEFVRWSKDSLDQKMKTEYYPNVDKADFFKLHYINEKSGHTRGSTVDLTIIDLKTNQELDMGTYFDFMDELSHPTNKNVTLQQYENRQLLNKLMIKYGFVPLETEWWHFTLSNELYPNTYFNFMII